MDDSIPNESNLLAKDQEQSDLPCSSSSLVNAEYFSTLARIVDHLKKRYFDNPTLHLSLDEILEEIQAFDTNKKNKQLLHDNLPINPRIQASDDGKFKFKPPYKIKGKTSLIKLLKKRHENGAGALLLSDLAECVPLSEKLLESLGKEAIIIDTKMNGKQDKAIFWNDPSTDLEVDEGMFFEFKAVWRSISSVEMLSHFAQEGIEVEAPIPAQLSSKEEKGKTRKSTGKMKNEHMSETLEDYGSTY